MTVRPFSIAYPPGGVSRWIEMACAFRAGTVQNVNTNNHDYAAGPLELMDRLNL